MTSLIFFFLKKPAIPNVGSWHCIPIRMTQNSLDRANTAPLLMTFRRGAWLNNRLGSQASNAQTLAPATMNHGKSQLKVINQQFEPSQHAMKNLIWQKTNTADKTTTEELKRTCFAAISVFGWIFDKSPRLSFPSGNICRRAQGMGKKKKLWQNHRNHLANKQKSQNKKLRVLVRSGTQCWQKSSSAHLLLFG